MFARVGIIGSGPVGRAIATRALAARIPVVLSNSRGPNTLTELVGELGEGASAGTVAQAADADLVVVAIPFVKVPKLSAEVADWSGRVVVSLGILFRIFVSLLPIALLWVTKLIIDVIVSANRMVNESRAAKAIVS